MDKEQELLSEALKIIDKAITSDIVDGRFGATPYAKELVAKLKSLGYEQVWEKCPKCGGEGGVFPEGKPSLQDPAKPNDTCPACNGTGKVRIQFKLPEGIEEKIKKTIDAFRWEYTKAKIVNVTGLSPEASNLMEDRYAKLILSQIRQDIVKGGSHR